MIENVENSVFESSVALTGTTQRYLVKIQVIEDRFNKSEVTIMNNMNNIYGNPSENFDQQLNGGNLLWKYVQSLHPETVSQLSKPDPEVAQIMEQNLKGMLGHLPPENFGVAITTSRESLGQLLASAMMSGYFLNKAKQRMELDRSIQCLNFAEDK